MKIDVILRKNNLLTLISTGNVIKHFGYLNNIDV